MSASGGRGTTIRTATDADADSVGRLAIELHEFTARGVPGWLRVPDTYDVSAIRERIQGIIQNPDAEVFVAEAGDELIGFVELYVEEAESSPLTVPVRRGHVQSLVVAASVRGSGVGTLLMDAAEAWASERGAREIRLRVWDFEDGPLGFYDRIGYSTTSREVVKALSRRSQQDVRGTPSG